jgi:protein-S-isoprenylcysteine O-methyltransferase Ste14
VALLYSGFWGVALLPATVAVIRRGAIERKDRYPERAFGEEYLR